MQAGCEIKKRQGKQNNQRSDFIKLHLLDRKWIYF